jgi:parvulin-like peptidyl-prolyl isomerase
VAAPLLLFACRKPAPAPDVVAESRSGPVALREVEVALSAVPAPERAANAPAADVADQVGRYRKAAESLVVERALLQDHPEIDRALRDLGKDYERMRREAVIEVFEREAQAAKPLRVTDAEVEQYFKDHPEEFHRRAQRLVYFIFRRHEDPAKPDATVAFLKGLKERVARGEAFRILVARYSHSETRAFEGRLGMIGRGRLPRRLDEVVFALPKGGVSEPVLVPGGAVMFEVTEVLEEKRFPLEDVRGLVADTIRERKARERVTETLAGHKAPEGSVILDSGAVLRHLESSPEDEVILKLGATEWTVKEFREAAAVEEGRARALPGPTPQERQARLYERLVQQALLFDKLEADGFASAPQRQRVINERVRSRGRVALVRRGIEDRIWKKVDADPSSQRQFYEENRFLYQSPLRLRIRTLRVPARADAPRKIAEMEGLRDALVKGELDLETAATRLGGQVQEAVWLDPAGLGALDPKVRVYLLDMNGPGYTVPFQLNRFLNLVHVEKREEPHQLPYDEVKERVRRDYRDRKQQELYQAVVRDVLAAQSFRFHDDVVRRALAGPATGD